MSIFKSVYKFLCEWAAGMYDILLWHTGVAWPKKIEAVMITNAPKVIVTGAIVTISDQLTMFYYVPLYVLSWFLHKKVFYYYEPAMEVKGPWWSIIWRSLRRPYLIRARSMEDCNENVPGVILNRRDDFPLLFCVYLSDC